MLREELAALWIPAEQTALSGVKCFGDYFWLLGKFSNTSKDLAGFLRVCKQEAVPKCLRRIEEEGALCAWMRSSLLLKPRVCRPGSSPLSMSACRAAHGLFRRNRVVANILSSWTGPQEVTDCSQR